MNQNMTIPSTKPKQETSDETEDVNFIEVTISEVDRQTANHFRDIHNCLVCTSLKNRGLNVEYADPSTVVFKDGSKWDFDEYMGVKELHALEQAENSPYFDSNVVGKTIRLRKRV